LGLSCSAAIAGALESASVIYTGQRVACFSLDS
jgi:hypothetical protein